LNNFLAAIANKISGSTLSDDVNGRIYLDEAEDFTLPHIVYFVVTAPKAKTFQESFRNALVQFSIFTARTAGVAAMSAIYNDMDALFDECVLTVTGDTFLRMREENLTTMMEEDTTIEGAPGIRHWAVDYLVEVQL
jgi:hypothetical protein